MNFHEPTSLGKNKTVANRIVLAPLTNLQSNDDGTLGDDEYRWLVRRAEGGFGIIISCAAYVSDDGKGWEGELGISSEKHLPGLKRLADGIHENGSLGIVQIFHGGARSPEKVTGKIPLSASSFPVSSSGKTLTREAIGEDIQNVIHSFVNAAHIASQAGWDGVELHGAHGYLLHQFLSTETNKRTDEWGGNFENRSRLLLSILKKIRHELPGDFIVGVRLSPEDYGVFKGIDFDESLKTAEKLAAQGADYIHVSAWDSFKKPEKYPDKDKSIVEYFREALATDVKLMVAGKIWTPEEAEKILSLGADLAVLGRVAIGNPDWPKLAAGKDFSPLRPPFSKEHLRKVSVGERFINYLQGRWKNFVK
ncbi:MAG: NADH:flavin oxidoreductase [Bacteroidetes bacterium]|nr:NADH:flavin oxidoreductase [Bacteroidota bacterium]